MKFIEPRHWRPLAALFSATLLAACDNNGSKVQPVVPPLTDTTYSADIVWTEYGIPHVTAQDWGSLGYGYGYAYAQQNYCVVMKEYVRANGESARYLGDEGDLNADKPDDPSGYQIKLQPRRAEDILKSQGVLPIVAVVTPRKGLQ